MSHIRFFVLNRTRKIEYFFVVQILVNFFSFFPQIWKHQALRTTETVNFFSSWAHEVCMNHEHEDFLVCASACVWSFPWGLPPSQHRRRRIVFRVLFQQTKKQTNKCDPETDSEAGSHCQADMSDLNYIPPDQHDQDWALLRGMVITLIDEVRNSDASTDVNDSIEDVNDFLLRAPPLLLWILSTLQESRTEIADREIKIIKRYGRLAPFPFPSTRILSTSGVAVLCIFQVYLGWVCWRGVYLLFLQLQ